MKDQELLELTAKIEEADGEEKQSLWKSLTVGLADKFGITKADSAAEDDDDEDDGDNEEDEEDDVDVDQYGLDDEYTDDDEDDVDLDDSKKSFYHHAEDEEILAEVMDGDQIIKAMFQAFSKALDVNMRRHEKRLRRLEKSLAKRHGEIRKAIGVVQTDLDAVGSSPVAGAARPYDIVKSMIAGDAERNPDVVLAKSLEAVQAGRIDGKECRMLELGMQNNQWDAQCDAIWKRVSANGGASLAR